MSSLLSQRFEFQWFPSYANLKRQGKSFQRFHNKHTSFAYPIPLGGDTY